MIRAHIVIALTGLCALLACSAGDAPRPTDSSDANLSAASSADPSEDSDVDCRNPSRSFHCSGERCCTEEPTCAEGQLPFSDVCGCGCDGVSSDDACEQPNRTFVCRGGRDCCIGIDWICPEGTRGFVNGCGCGCEP
jgi:hypothetical protein